MDQRRMCPNCRAFITTHDKVCPYCNERVGPRAVERRDPGAILGGFIPHARFVTMIILTINFGLYLATVVFSQRNGQGGLSQRGRADAHRFRGQAPGAIIPTASGGGW
jgi:rhomboid protease GluP